VEFSASAPVATNVLWVDTDDPGDAVIPVGGTTGQYLTKSSNSDYDTGWTTLSLAAYATTASVNDLTIMNIMQAY
jgi:hypothetical protein